MGRCSWVVLLAGVFASPLVPAAVFTVGADGACTHGSILAAVSAAASNGAGLDEIRVAANQTYSAVIAPVASHNLTVRGGYSSCTDTTASGRTVVGGGTTAGNSTFQTSGTAASYQLNLENLELRDGSNANRRGGAVRVEGRFTVTLRNTTVVDNVAARGGGVYIDGANDAELVIDAASTISNNTATVSGGGVFCRNNGSVTLEGLVLANTAQDTGSDPAESGNGGGIALYDCFMNQEDSPGFRGVLANTALRHGGGYYLRNGSELFVTGNGDDPGKITDNIAGDTGGGIAVGDDTGSTSQFDVFNSWIERNIAPTGAGIGLVTGGVGTIARTLAGAACHDATYCSSLSLNDQPSSATFCNGGAAFVGPRGVLRIRGTRVEENCTLDGGTAFRQRSDSQLRIDSSVIADNGGSPFFIDLQFSGLLEIAWSTVTRNFASLRIGMFTVPNDDSNGTLRVYGTLLGEPFQQMLAVGGIGGLPPMTFTFDCLVVDTAYTQSLTPIRGVELAPPYGMISPAGGNFRLASGSALPVDWCDGSVAPRVAGDADGQTTIYDAPRPNQFGTRDIGAYEFVVPALPDLMFANGFE